MVIKLDVSASRGAVEPPTTLPRTMPNLVALTVCCVVSVHIMSKVPQGYPSHLVDMLKSYLQK